MVKLLDFYADWCGPCQAMKPIFAEIEKEFADKVEFQVIDVENDPQMLSDKFGVRSIPTYILVKEDKEVSRKIGAMPKDMLKGWLEQNL
ncbi:MAG TPA: thioredoxin domain-containing protein [Candidatus Saccharimonadales bacterium]|nr:thioredoxin domain-containing protein [Candidatus Saccharimonadales bacterium]